MNEISFYVSQMEKLKASEEIKQKMSYSSCYKEAGVRRHYRIGAWAAALTVLVLGLFVVPSPLSSKVRASCILAFHSINEMIYGAHQDVSDYVTGVSQTDTDGDISLQLNEAVIDGTELVCTYTLACDTPRFFTREEENSATYKGYYDLLLDSITVNGETRKSEEKVQLDGFMEMSTDSYTYWLGGTYDMRAFADMLQNPEDILSIELKLSAINDETEDVRHFSYAFQITNRELQLETREIILDRSYELDGMTLVLDRLCINKKSQKIYYHIDNAPEIDKELEKKSYAAVHNAYRFILKGKDNRGIPVYVCFDLEGPGYSGISTSSDTEALNPDVQYYNFEEMYYDWTDPAYDTCDDEHEGEWHGTKGSIGEGFQIDCK